MMLNDVWIAGADNLCYKNSIMENRNSSAKLTGHRARRMGRPRSGTRNQPDILHYCLRVQKTGFWKRMELLLFSLMLKCKSLDAPVGPRQTMPLLTMLHDDKGTYIYPEASRTMAGWGLAAVSVAWLSFCLCGSVKLR